MEELRVENQQVPESSGTIGRSKGASISTSPQQISVTVVTEFVRWNEEAISRCTLFSSQVIFVPSINSFCFQIRIMRCLNPVSLYLQLIAYSNFLSNIINVKNVWKVET